MPFLLELDLNIKETAVKSVKKTHWIDRVFLFRLYFIYISVEIIYITSSIAFKNLKGYQSVKEECYFNFGKWKKNQ